ncbi:hypothetical protein TNCV_3416181 [Trichonephila clavipes]|nr:hypothetical protein TNCV_3416181 [Trichonephila clavipes]
MEYSDVNKRRAISKLADKSSEKAVYGTEKFKRNTFIVALDKLILDLNKRSPVYAEYCKKLKFLMDLQVHTKTKLNSVGKTWTRMICKIFSNVRDIFSHPVKHKLKTWFQKKYIPLLKQASNKVQAPLSVGDIVLISLDDKKRIDLP